MTKRAISLAIACIGTATMLATVERSSARELGVGNQYPLGLTLGDPAGVNLPAVGIYVKQRANVYSGNIVDSGGGKTDNTVNAAATSTTIYFAPGWTFLGATYMAFIAQPYVELTTRIDGVTSRTAGFANTSWVPISLSWTLSPGLFVSTAFAFYGPDGSIQGPQKTGGVAAPFWTFEPSFAVSYLRDGYNLTAHVVFNFNTANTATNFTSGNQVFVDLTATKKFGNWEIGPVAYYAEQISSDSDPNGVYAHLAALNIPGSNPYSKPRVLALGGLVGYDWGPVSAQINLSKEVYARDTSKGWTLWANLSFRLWGEDRRH